jgi:acetylornithine deacetylase/succinyl-diaminopimelate desuccinylase-like protein
VTAHPPARTAALLGLALAGTLAATGRGDAQQLDRDRLQALTDEFVQFGFQTYHEFLRLPNDAANHPDDLDTVIQWLEVAFQARGFHTERLPTPSIDLLLAERTAPGADRTVLIYLQADGQPVDTTAWSQASPWTPVLKEQDESGQWTEIPWARLYGDYDDEWRIFARSAADSKGPIAQFLTALTAMDEAGAKPDFNIKVIIDTEEELGSPPLPEAVRRFRDKLAADMLVIFDGPPHASGQPTLTFGARGIASLTLTTFGPRAPQHSGHYGNYLPNPALRLAQILASMKDEHGRVTIPSFYDGITIDDETRRILSRVPDDEVEIQRAMGVAKVDSVAGSLQEALQYPSLNIRGMRAAWVGSESRTIIPATATAEIDVRLVVESDPDRLLGLIREHIEGLGYQVIDHAPTDQERLAIPNLVRFNSSVSYRAFRTDFNSEPGRWLRAAMVHLNGEDPIMIRTGGGSIPISPFVSTLGIPAVIVPSVNPDNNQHSPNENLRVRDFVEGIRTLLGVLTQPLPSAS